MTKLHPKRYAKSRVFQGEMGYILLDESGDLGFDFDKEKTTKHFVVTVIFAKKKRPIEKCVRQVYRGLRKKYRRIHHVLHAYKEEPATRRRLLEKLARKDCTVMAIYLNKQKVYTRLQSEKAVVYNYVTNILLDRVISKRLVPVSNPICLVASKRETNKFLNENFSTYLQDQTKNSHKLDLKIEIRTPAEERSLQAADFASWAIFRKLEYGDDYYYNIIKDIIVEENVLFP